MIGFLPLVEKRVLVRNVPGKTDSYRILGKRLLTERIIFQSLLIDIGRDFMKWPENLLFFFGKQGSGGEIDFKDRCTSAIFQQLSESGRPRYKGRTVDGKSLVFTSGIPAKMGQRLIHCRVLC